MPIEQDGQRNNAACSPPSRLRFTRSYLVHCRMLLLRQQCVPLASLRCASLSTMPLRRFYVAGNNKTNLCLNIKCQTFLSDFTQSWIFSTEFHREKVSKIKSHETPSRGSRLATRGHTDLMKLVEGTRENANATKNQTSVAEWNTGGPSHFILTDLQPLFPI